MANGSPPYLHFLVSLLYLFNILKHATTEVIAFSLVVKHIGLMVELKSEGFYWMSCFI